MSKTRRIYSIVLTLATVLVLLCSCAAPKTGADASSAAAAAPTAGSAAADAGQTQTPPAADTSGASNPMPIIPAGQTQTISMACPDNYYSAAPTTDELPAWAWIKEQTGVSVNWQVVPNSEYSTTIQTRMAAGVDLPDILSAGSLDTTIYGEDGMLVELSPYLEKYGENYAIIAETAPNVKPLMMTPSGSIYHLSTTRSEELYAGAQGWEIRYDWLENLNLEMPVTTDDWYQVLKAFKEQDANLDGDPNNEVPMTTMSNVTNIYRWGNCWGLRLWTSDGFSIDENGKVQYDFLKDEAREMTEYVARLFKEGLMDPEAITNTSDDLTSKCISNNYGSTLYWQELCPTWNITLHNLGITQADWGQTRTPVGPNGYPGHIETRGYVSGQWSISKDCQDVDTAFRWLEYVLYNEAATVTRTIGIEDMTYTVDDNGGYHMTEFVTNNPDGLGYVEAIRSIGAWSPVSVCNRADLIALFKLADDKEIARCEAVYDQIIPKTEFAISTLDESDAITRLYTDITTYRDEMMTKFFLGTESIDEKWEEFTRTLESMGIHDVLAVKQQQYDRLLSFGYEQ